MEFERKFIDGIEWFICNGQEYRNRYHAIDRLQREYLRSGCQCVWGKTSGCWDALWLAEQYDVRCLVLEDCKFRMRQALSRTARWNTFAVVCPVIICSCAEKCPNLPNAQVYRADDAGQIPGMLRSLGLFCAENTNDL